MPTKYTIEEAKSGRSSCKNTKCKGKIDKDELRIGVHVEVDDHFMSKWYHVECFPKPKKLGASKEEFVEEYLEDETKDKLLQNETSKEVIIRQMEKGVRKSGGDDDDGVAGSSTGPSDYLQNIKTHAAILIEEKEEDNGSSSTSIKPSKKAKRMSKGEKALAEAYLKFASMKNAELQDVLVYNRVKKTGTKEALLIRVVDGYVNGRIGRCLDCQKGKLSITDDGDAIQCKGYFDEEGGYRVSCKSRFPVDAVQRYKPWFIQELTDEEEALMDEQMTVGKESNGEADTSKLPGDLVQAVNNIEWDLSSKQNIKKVTTAMVELCASETSPIDFPSALAKGKMEVGKMILEHKNESASVVLNLIVAKYGLKEKNAKNAKRRTEQVEAAMTVGANAGIVEAFNELAELYFAEKNSNAAISYKKVIEAIKELDFEITEENALGLGMGKTKVDRIGKASAIKIHQFVTTGEIEKLVEKRAQHA